VIQPVELLLLLSPARTGDQTEVFYVTKIEIYVSGYHETGCGFFGLGVKKRQLKTISLRSSRESHCSKY
ncbi:hypothetical protein, partial [uncultured Gimesia sp.]|uniref:hypothetical protein n=1 Tax=uncultured Gimesia sp. TaxID=1678688 RepID=UPI00260DECB1